MNVDFNVLIRSGVWTALDCMESVLGSGQLLEVQGPRDAVRLAVHVEGMIHQQVQELLVRNLQRGPRIRPGPEVAERLSGRKIE